MKQKFNPIFEKGRSGGQVQYIKDKAIPYLNGTGLDIGCNAWKIKEDAIGVDIVKKKGVDLIISNWGKVDSGIYDYVFSSHCLEHILDWEITLFHWVRVIKKGGIIFLYLPNPAAYNRWSKKYAPYHKHDFTLSMITQKLSNLGVKIIDKGLDDYASIWVIGIKGKLKLFT